MRISSYKTSSAILIEEYYVLGKLKYQTSCTLPSIKTSASMNKGISHVGQDTLHMCSFPCRLSQRVPNLLNVLITFQRFYADRKLCHFIPRWVLNDLPTAVTECVINHCFKASFFCSRDNIFPQ